MAKNDIYSAPFNPIVGDIPGNIQKIKSIYHDGLDAGAVMVITPEMSICGYPCDDLWLEDEFIIVCETAVHDLARDIQTNTALVVGHPIKQAGHVYNGLSVIQSQQVVYQQCKCALPNYNTFDEKRYFKPGKPEDAHPIDISGVK